MKTSLKPYIVSLVSYMVEHKYVTRPIPRIHLVARPQDVDPLFAKTGDFDPRTNEIRLYTAGRHPKDILRTLAHELIHVNQAHEGRLRGFDSASSLQEDDVLREIEGEAFYKGNLALRDWTEQYTHSQKVELRNHNQVNNTI